MSTCDHEFDINVLGGPCLKCGASPSMILNANKPDPQEVQEYIEQLVETLERTGIQEAILTAFFPEKMRRNKMTKWKQETHTSYKLDGEFEGMPWRVRVTSEGDDGFSWSVGTGWAMGNRWSGSMPTLVEAQARAECLLEQVLIVERIAKYGLRGDASDGQ